MVDPKSAIVDGKTRVLHILGEILPSGGETMLASAAGVFAAEGIQSTALSTGQSIGSFAPSLEAAGFEIEHIPFSKRLAHFLKVRNLIRENRFDVVHIHGERAFFYYILAAKAAGCRRIIRTVHHIFPWSGWLRLRSLLQRQIARRIFGVTFVSNSRSGWENERHCYFMNNSLIPNWYDSAKFTTRSPTDYEKARQLLGIAPETFAVVSLGGNSSYKNYHLVIEAIDRLSMGVGAVYFQVGNQGGDRPLSTLAEKLGIAERVRCCGRVPDALPYLHAADAYVMPSSIEGFGVAAAEAMAVGVPAILSHRPALKDFAEVTMDIAWCDCSAQSIAEQIEQLASLSAERRWQRGQALSCEIAKYCGLGAGPVRFSQLYKHGTLMA